MTLVLKALIGAAIVVMIDILSKSRFFYLAGLLPLFPTFALISHYIIGTTRQTSDLKATALFGMASLIPYFIYLLLVYFLSDRVRIQYSLFFSVVAWVIAASSLVKIWGK